MIRATKSREERLEDLTARLNEAQRKEPLNSTIADLSYQILMLKKSLRIETPDEKHHLIGLLLEHAYTMKSEVRDRHAASFTFEKILRLNPRNPIANYRYAFLCYEDRNWIKAINHFQKAIQFDNPDFPLAADQIIKANLFVGYCASMLAKESIAKADRWSGETVETPSGEISIDELTNRFKRALASTEILLVTNNEEKLISKEGYEELILNIDSNSLLLDFTTEAPCVQSGQSSSEIPIQLANLLKKLLVKSTNEQPLSWSELTGYQAEEISDVMDITWDNYRTKISRIRQILKKVGLSDNLIENIPKRNSYKMSTINYYIVQYDAK